MISHVVYDERYHKFISQYNYPIFHYTSVLVLFAPANDPHGMVSRSRTGSHVRTLVHARFVHEEISSHFHHSCKYKTDNTRNQQNASITGLDNITTCLVCIWANVTPTVNTIICLIDKPSCSLL